MLWGKNKGGQKIGVINWTRHTIDHGDAQHLVEQLRKAAERVAREDGKSLVLLVDVGFTAQEVAEIREEAAERAKLLSEGDPDATPNKQAESEN